MIVLGIDEAGYGPLLGPLVVTGVAFETPGDDGDVCLWKLLSGSVCRSPGRRERRLPIADSKQLFDRKHGLTALERPALVMLRTAGHQPAQLVDLLDLIAPRASTALAGYPWYSGLDEDLPASTTDADIGTRANAVRRDMTRRGVRLAGVFVELFAEGEFNGFVRRTRNKAAVTSYAVTRIVTRAQARFAGQRLCVRVDRQGGRQHYGPTLMLAFPELNLKIVEESEARSAYELRPIADCAADARVPLLSSSGAKASVPLPSRQCLEPGSRPITAHCSPSSGTHDQPIPNPQPLTLGVKYRSAISKRSGDPPAADRNPKSAGLSIEFLVGGEQVHLPIALASIYSKYVRELLMERINAYFCSRCPQLAPTAGYHNDAFRFLAAIEPLIQAEGIDRSRLVRER